MLMSKRHNEDDWIEKRYSGMEVDTEINGSNYPSKIDQEYYALS